MTRMDNNRGGGSHRMVDVKPPSVLSRDFTPINNNLLPMSLDDMIDKTANAGFFLDHQRLRCAHCLRRKPRK